MSEEIRAFVDAGKSITYRGVQQIDNLSPQASRAFLTELQKDQSSLEVTSVKCEVTDNPYYLGDAGKKIADVLAQISLGTKVIRKKMTLTGEAQDGWYR